MKKTLIAASIFSIFATTANFADAKTVEYTTDIAVVGGGSAGLSAAVTAADAGAKVILLEKNPYLGGASNFAEGLFAVESDYQKLNSYGLTRDEAFEKIEEYTHYLTDGKIERDFIEASADDIHWLRDLGVNFKAVQISPMEPATWHVIQPNGHIVHGGALITTLQERAEKDGVQFLMRTPGTSLIYKDGKVEGVKGTDHKGNEVIVHAKAVIIGSGGFGNSPEKIKEFTGIDGSTAPGTLPLHKTGEAIDMAHKVGAYGGDEILMMHIGTSGKGIIPMGDLFTMTWQPTNMWVNNLGNRFVNEEIAFSFAEAGNALHQQPGSSGWAIFDQNLVDYAVNHGVDNGVGVIVPVMKKLNKLNSEIKVALSAKSEAFKQAKSVKELAKEIGVPYENLENAFKSYNKACENKYDYDYLKGRSNLVSLNEKNVYAIKLSVFQFTSLGGIRTNPKMEAVRKDSTEIKGLYATGNDVSGLYSDTYTLWASGHAYGFAVYSGRTAAKNAVKYIKN
ncbi:FAD-dependent oxidoreductase [Shewanella yunxiaonensis]|uniref:FAD-dependent oxidoreductase n=1 Tax=Shewanella yunxiaonensis TaxID=2829809 RepID=A0ABX7YWF9_9GAMM|nr:FAD-dependent oxidoreductase [Shewanella yunxiaonensis]QUN06985.1 FAD-dependent oxidoreductase [Shewanella yunxiaonensis]